VMDYSTAVPLGRAIKELVGFCYGYDVWVLIAAVQCRGMSRWH
jgi:hypothetical protein